MTQFFDGKRVAKDLTIKLRKESKELSVSPKLVSILVGDDPSSKLYLRLKKKAADRVGCELSIINYSSGPGQRQFSTKTREIIKKIEKLNSDDSVHGIMVQLPLPKSFSINDRDKIINSIDPKKDVDGMRDNSPYVAPVVQAVVTVLEKALVASPLKSNPLRVVVIGNKGFEGGKIFEELKKKEYKVAGVDVGTRNAKRETLKADIIISATGVPNLIKPGMVKKEAVLIDVGSPKGDIDESAYKKASFVSPVPGGIGPLTITYLLSNIIKTRI